MRGIDPIRADVGDNAPDSHVYPSYNGSDHSGHWFRAYGNENWRFGSDGLMAARAPTTTRASATSDADT